MILIGLLLDTQTSQVLETETKTDYNQLIHRSIIISYTQILHYLFLNLRLYASRSLNHNPVSRHFCSTNRQSHTSWGEKILLTGHQGQLLPLYPVNTAEESDRAKAVWGEEVNLGWWALSPLSLFITQNFLQAGASFRGNTQWQTEADGWIRKPG